MTQSLALGSAADRAGLGSGAGSIIPLVTQSGSQHLAANGAGLCVLAVGGSAEGMTQSLALGGAANRAGLGSGAGSIIPLVTQSGGQNLTANGTGLIVHAVGGSAGGVAQSSNGLGVRIAADRAGKGLHASSGTGGGSGLHALIAVTAGAGIAASRALAGIPATAGGANLIGGARLGAFGIQHSAVAVGQLNRGQGDVVVDTVSRSVLVVHHAENVTTGTVHHLDDAGTLGRADVGAATGDGVVLVQDVRIVHGAVNKAVGDDGAVDVQLGIHQVSLGAGIPLGAGEGHRTGTHTGLSIPIVVVAIGHHLKGVHIDTVGIVGIVEHLQNVTAGGHHVGGGVGIGQIQGSTLIHGQAGTGQHHHVLLQGGGAALNADVHIVADGQYELSGIHVHAGNAHGQLGQSAIAVRVQIQAVGGGIVILHHVRAGLGTEHSVSADELHGGAVLHTGHIHRGVHVLGGAVLIGGGYLDVLHVILGGGEHQEALGQLGGLVTTAEVHDLEVLVDGGTALGGDGAIAVNVTPGVQGSAVVHVDVRTGLHLDKAQRAGGATTVATVVGCTAGSGRVTTADLNHTVDGDVRVGAQGQGAVAGGRFPSNTTLAAQQIVVAGAFGVLAVGSRRAVIGHQQGDAEGDGVGAGDGTVLGHHNLLVGAGLSGGNRIAQIVETLATHGEVSGIAGDEHRLDGGVATHRQGGGGIIVHIRGGGLVIPTEESITAGGSRLQRIAALGGRLLVAGLGSDRSAVHRVATALNRQEGGGDVAVTDQLDAGDGQGVGAGTAGRGQGDDQSATGGQIATVRITGNTGHRAAAAQSVAEGQLAGVGIVVFNGQLSGNGAGYETQRFIAGGGTGDGIACGGPGGLTTAVAGIGPGKTDVGVGHRQGARRRSGYGEDGKHRHNHSQSQ